MEPGDHLGRAGEHLAPQLDVVGRRRHLVLEVDEGEVEQPLALVVVHPAMGQQLEQDAGVGAAPHADEGHVVVGPVDAVVEGPAGGPLDGPPADLAAPHEGAVDVPQHEAVHAGVT